MLTRATPRAVYIGCGVIAFALLSVIVALQPERRSPLDSLPPFSEDASPAAHDYLQTPPPANQVKAAGSVARKLDLPSVIQAPRAASRKPEDASTTRRPAIRRLPPSRAESRDQIEAARRQVARFLERGKRLAERGALVSAETEFRRSLDLLTQTKDALDGGNRNATVEAAFVACDEAEEFLSQSRRSWGFKVQNVAAGHRTPVLKRQDVSAMPFAEAARRYFQFAEGQLVAALRDVPGSAHSLFLLGKLYKASADVKSDAILPARAATCQRAAVAIEPTHYLAANELGVLLASQGQWASAKTFLLKSLRTRPTVQTWRNLAIVHTQLREPKLAKLATIEADRLSGVRAAHRDARTASPSR